jgi:hypothetical protein
MRPRGSSDGSLGQTLPLCYRSREHAVALVIDELLGLRDRERDGVVAAVVRIRSDELVLFQSIRRVSLDRSRRLVVIVG